MIIGYEVAASSLAPAASAAYVNLWSPSRGITVREVFISQTTTTPLPQLQLIRTTARGTQSTTVTPTAAANAQNTAFASPTAVVDTAWSVQPTFAAIPMRMEDVAGVVGSFSLWTWSQDGEIFIASGNGLALLNNAGGTGGVIRVYFVIGE